MFQNLQLQTLNPFGLEITAKESLAVSALSPLYLEEMLKEHKLILLRGFETVTKEDLLGFCQNFPNRDLLQWSFGPVMEMHERPDPQNYLFSREKVPFHWDGAFAIVPSYLVFQCVQAPAAGAGGETLFTDTEQIWQQAPAEEKVLFEKAELSYETEKLAHYGGVIRGPLLQSHPQKRTAVLRYAEPVTTKLNPVTMTISGLTTSEAGQVQQSLQEKIYDDRYCYVHDWQTGDVLIADNHSLIHGRRSFENGSPRHLRRIQLL